MITPRPYQVDALQAVQSGWKQFRKQLGIAPTGAGKTILFSHLAHAELPGRTLILAHRDELLDQAIEKLHRATGIFAQKEKAGARASLHAEVVVASIQTMSRRLDKWPRHHFSLVVVDEAHHGAADSYLNVLRHFDQSAKVLGVTATPDRADRKNLGAYFESIAFEIPLFQLIHQNYLSPIRVKALPVKIPVDGLRKVAGDYAREDIASKLEPYLRSIAQAIREHAAFRKTLVFLPLIATSREFTRICLEEGINAAHVDGTSPDRREILDRFAAGEIDLLNNPMLLSEGYDEPSIDCVIVLRPTRSRALYSQMIGRGTRLAPGKNNLLLLDFLWMHEKHDLIRPAHLVATSRQEEADMRQLLEQSSATQEEFDLEDLQGLARARREESLRREIETKARRLARTVDPVEFCLNVNNFEIAEYEPTCKWEEKPVTEGQAHFLRQQGIDPAAVKCKGQASRIIEILINRRRLKLASPKQMKWLRKFGHPSPETCSFKEATTFLDQRWGSEPVNQEAVAA